MPASLPGFSRSSAEIVPPPAVSPAAANELKAMVASVEKLFYLPEAHTDFLLAVIAEELGFVGVAAIIAAITWVVMRAFMIGRRAAALERYFSAVVAEGVGLWIGVQAVINIGVNTGMLPTKGLTLPLVSFGGTALVAVCCAVGVLLRVDWENRQLAKGYTV